MKTLLYAIVIAIYWPFSAITYAKPSGWATAIAWSPDGDTIAVGSSDGLWFFDDSFNEIGHVALPQLEGFPPTTLDWSADGSMLALGIIHIPYLHQEDRIYTGDFPVLIVDADRQAVVNVIGLPRPRSPIRWRPRDHRILMASIDSTAYIFDAVTGKVDYTFHERIDDWNRVDAYSACWLTDSVVALFDSSEIHVIDIVNDKLLHRVEGGRSSEGLVNKPADCGEAGRAMHGFGHVFELLTGQRDLIHSPAGVMDLSDYWYYEWYGVAIAFSPDSKKIATNGNLSLCRTAVFDAESLHLIAEIQGSYAKRNKYYFQDSIAWRPAGEKLAIVGQFDIRIWDAETYKLLQRYEGFSAGYYDPHPSDTETDDNSTIYQNQLRDLKCPDIPNTMLFRQE